MAFNLTTLEPRFMNTTAFSFGGPKDKCYTSNTEVIAMLLQYVYFFLCMQRELHLIYIYLLPRMTSFSVPVLFLVFVKSTRHCRGQCSKKQRSGKTVRGSGSIGFFCFVFSSRVAQLFHEHVFVFVFFGRGRGSDLTVLLKETSSYIPSQLWKGSRDRSFFCMLVVIIISIVLRMAWQETTSAKFLSHQFTNSSLNQLYSDYSSGPF